MHKNIGSRSLSARRLVVSLAASASSAVLGAAVPNENRATAHQLMHVPEILVDSLPPPSTLLSWGLTLLAALLLAQVASFLASYHWIISSDRLGVPVMRAPRQGRSLPFLGQALAFLRYRPWDLLMDWHRTYGPIVGFRLLGHLNFSVASPALLKVVLQSKIAAVKKDVAFTMKPFLVILGTGIVTSEDDAWMRQRLKMSHPLRRDVLEAIPGQTLRAVKLLMARMDDAAGATAAPEPVPVGASLRRLTLQVISGAFLSLSAAESDATFARYYLPIVDEANARVWLPHRAYLPLLPAWWAHLYNVYRLNTYVAGLVRARWAARRRQEREAAPGAALGPRDILDRMLAVYEKEVRQQRGALPVALPEVHVRQLRDEMKTFMLAGHETSAAMMTWAIYEVMANPTLLRELQNEANAVFDPQMDWKVAQESDLPSAEDLSKLVLSEATLKEALRKYSVVPLVARRTIADMHIHDNGRDYLLPKGSSLLINIQTVHHDPSLWPKPMVFDPQRFLHKEPEPYTFLPFIAGPRNCLGQYLALLESKMVISLLLQRYKFSLPEGETLEVADWSGSHDPRHRYMVPVIPAKELMVHVSLNE